MVFIFSDFFSILMPIWILSNPRFDDQDNLNKFKTWKWKGKHVSFLVTLNSGFAQFYRSRVQKNPTTGFEQHDSNPRIFSTSSKWPQAIGLASSAVFCENVCTMCAITCMSFKFEPNLNKFEIFEKGLLGGFWNFHVWNPKPLLFMLDFIRRSLGVRG